MKLTTKEGNVYEGTLEEVLAIERASAKPKTAFVPYKHVGKKRGARRKYATKEEAKAAQREQTRQWWKKNQKRMNKERAEKARIRYATDPEFRKATNERNKRYKQKNWEKIKKQREFKRNELLSMDSAYRQKKADAVQRKFGWQREKAQAAVSMMQSDKTHPLSFLTTIRNHSLQPLYNHLVRMTQTNGTLDITKAETLITPATGGNWKSELWEEFITQFFTYTDLIAQAIGKKDKFKLTSAGSALTKTIRYG